MTKTTTLVLAILFGAVALLLLLSPFWGCMVPFLICATVFGLVAWRKYQRDARIVAQAHLERITAAREMYVPPMTSKGSHGRLYVPPPLDN